MDVAPQLGESQLVRVAIELGAKSRGGPLSANEEELCETHAGTPLPDDFDLGKIRVQIARGDDPLGVALVGSRPPTARHGLGIVYTPPRIVEAMVGWIARKSDPRRVVDMGCGSGRFVGEAARRFPGAELVAVDVDPVATLLTRARLSAMRRPGRVVNSDYLGVPLEPIAGVTAFVGNPPYVRHHELSRDQKAKAVVIARALGFRLSGLSGLHAHFLFATAAKAAEGDIGCVITSAEWMQVGYGRAVRDLLAGRLGLEALHVLDPRSMAFPDTMTTAVVLGFRVGSARPHVVVTPHATAETLGRDNGGARRVPRDRLLGNRWGFLLRNEPEGREREGAPLGEVCRVHRGIATGANDFFTMTEADAAARGLTPWVRPVLSRAHEVIRSGGVVRSGPRTRVLLVAPKDVGGRGAGLLRDYLALGERRGIPDRYLCRHRRPWWNLGVAEPAPIVATYMARQPPAFALNPDGLLNLNVIHGLYPVARLDDRALRDLVKRLCAGRERFRGEGRTYQGGLEKFEPRELEALRVPPGRRIVRAAGAS